MFIFVCVGVYFCLCESECVFFMVCVYVDVFMCVFFYKFCYIIHKCLINYSLNT